MELHSLPGFSHPLAINRLNKYPCSEKPVPVVRLSDDKLEALAVAAFVQTQPRIMRNWVIDPRKGTFRVPQLSDTATYVLLNASSRTVHRKSSTL